MPFTGIASTLADKYAKGECNHLGLVSLHWVIQFTVVCAFVQIDARGHTEF